MSILWSRSVPPAARCPRCQSTRVAFIIPESPEMQPWRCLDCNARWEIWAGGQVVMPLPLDDKTE